MRGGRPAALTGGPVKPAEPAKRAGSDAGEARYGVPDTLADDDGAGAGEVGGADVGVTVGSGVTVWRGVAVWCGDGVAAGVGERRGVRRGTGSGVCDGAGELLCCAAAGLSPVAALGGWTHR